MTPSVEDDETEPAAGRRSATAYDLGRLFAFSDGVFAIAITILVLGIPIPDVPGGVLPPGALLGLAPNLIGFGLSFLLVGTQWIAHHRMLRQVTFCNGAILWVNLLLLMGICLVPFATSVLVRYGGTAAGAIPYAGLQAAIGVVFVSLRLYLLRHGVDLRGTLARSWVPVVVFLVSIPVALLNVYYAYALWLTGFALSRGLGPKLVAGLRRLDPPWTRSRS